MAKKSNFVEKTKRIIAGRSGYRCSIPDCTRVTIGPGASSSEIINFGDAAHIFSAKSGGPRPTGGLTEEELCSHENGIWLCANHHRLVDANLGNKYPPDLLLSFKTLHEARIARELQDISSPVGWFHECRIENSPVFRSHSVLRLGKLTLIVGDNGTGKTALCEWIAGFTNLSFLNRWRESSKPGYPINVFLKYYYPEEKSLEIKINNNGQLKYSDNGTAVPFNPNPIKVLYPLERMFHDTSKLNDLELISFLLGIDESLILNLSEDVQGYEHSSVKNIVFEPDDEGKIRLIADVGGTCPGLPFNALSGSEQERVIIEFATAAARCYARQVPTLLIFDGSIAIMSNSWLEYSYNHFNDTNSLFQTIIVIPTRTINIDKLKWSGWEVVRTSGKVPEVTFEQNIRSI